jgi:glycerol kinase
MAAVLAFDQGTTSSRAILFDHGGSIFGMAQREFRQHYPRPGWVEHDPEEIWESQLAVAREVLQTRDLDPREVAAIGIANQRETTILWDRKTGQPVYNAIVWQDRRTADDCESLRQLGHEELVYEKTRLLIDSYFCATKIRWLLNEVPGVRARAERGELAFGTVDSWLIWKATGGKVHATDVTNASRTMLMNVHECQWDDELLELFDIPRELLPKIEPSSHAYGQTDPQLLGASITLGGAAGDQQAALFGQNCTQHGMAKNTYGTGCFLLMNVGDQPLRSNSKLLTSVACSGGDQRDYALEGSIFVAGAAVQWLRDGLGIIDRSSDVESLAASVPDSDGVYMVPAFAGLGAPHWDPHARGTLLGITRGTCRAHIARAALESIAFQVADVADAMNEDAPVSIRELRVDGGASANDLLMQFQADVLQIPVVRPQVIETTALGAAYLAGLAVGFWDGIEAIGKGWAIDRTFLPEMHPDEVAERRSRWRKALQRSRDWAS